MHRLLIAVLVLALVGAAGYYAYLGLALMRTEAPALKESAGSARPSGKPQAPARTTREGDAKAQVPAPQSAAGSPDSVSGVVLDPDQMPVQGARVVLLRLRREWPRQADAHELERVLTGPEGEFDFIASRATDLAVEVRARGFSRLFESAPPQDPSLTLHLTPGFRVRGKVYAPDGQPESSCAVFLEPGFGSQMRAIEGRTDSKGVFVFEGVPAEVIRITARHQNWHPVSLPSVTVGRVQDFQLEFTAEEGDALGLSGMVHEAGDGGKPIVGAEISVYPNTANGALFIPYTTTTDASGGFRVHGLGHGKYTVEVRHKEYSTAARHVTLNSSRIGLEFGLMGRALVRGRLQDGGGLVAKEISLVSRFGQIQKARIASDGSFQFPEEGCTLGPATLELEEGEYAFKKSSERRLRVRLEDEGENHFELELEKATAVAGMVFDRHGVRAAGVRILARLVRRGSLLAKTISVLGVTNERGEYLIRGLPPGKLRLCFKDDVHAFHELSVVVDEEKKKTNVLPVRLAEPATVTGRVTRGGKPVAGAMVFVGRGFEMVAKDISRKDGSYALRSLPAGRHLVRARLSTLPIARSPRPVAVEAGDLVQDLNLKFPPGRRIEGTVVDIEDTPIANVLVGEPGGSRTRTDEAGRFALDVPLGPVKLALLIDKGTPFFSRVPPDTTGKLPPIRVARSLRGSLHARVLGLPERRPLSGGILRLDSEESKQAGLKLDLPFGVNQKLLDLAQHLVTMKEMEERQRQGAVERWVEMSGGVLQVDNLPAGKFQLILHCRGYEPLIRSVTIRPNKPLDLGDALLERGARLRGRVLAPDGKPVRGARILLGRESDLTLPEARSDYLTDENGFFEVDGVSPKSCDLHVAAEGFTWAHHRIRVPADLMHHKPLTIKMQRGATIEVSVVNRRGEPQPFKQVLLSRSIHTLSRSRSGVDGKARFHNLAVGEYYVRLSRDLRSTQRLVVEDSSGAKVYKARLRHSRRPGKGKGQRKFR